VKYPSKNYKNNGIGCNLEQELKVGDRIWVSVKDEHKNIFTPENIHNFSGIIWQIDDEHVYVKSSSGALNRYPWWAIDYKTDMDIGKPGPEQDENFIMEYDKWSGKNNPVKAGYVGTFKAGYKSGQTSRNAEIEDLKAEIESMRCCGNCDNKDLFHGENNCVWCGKCKTEDLRASESHWTRTPK